MNQKIKLIFTFLFIFALESLVFLLIRNHHLIIDEYYHYGQIIKFIKGDFTLMPGLSVLPGYHFIIALLLRFISQGTLPAARFITFLFNLSTVFLFYLVGRKMDKSAALIKTLQYSFFPLIFPFFPLVYSDITSIFFVLLVFYLAQSKKYSLAGIAAIGALLVRQTNIVWVGMVHLLIINASPVIKKTVIEIMIKTWSFFLCYLLFIIFVIENKGLATGGKDWQTFSLNPNNIYLFLFSAFFLFFPSILANLPRIFHFLRKRKVWLLSLPFFFFLFLLTFANTHPWNQYTYFIRNKIMIYFTSSLTLKTLFFVPVALSFFYFAKTKLYKKSYFLLYPATILFLLPNSLIEERYYFIPFTLFLLFKRKEKGWVEYATLVLFMALSFYLFEGMANWRFFL